MGVAKDQEGCDSPCSQEPIQSGQVTVARVRGACVREKDTQLWTQQKEMSLRGGGRLERA